MKEKEESENNFVSGVGPVIEIDRNQEHQDPSAVARTNQEENFGLAPGAEDKQKNFKVDTSSATSVIAESDALPDHANAAPLHSPGFDDAGYPGGIGGGPALLT